MDRSRPWRDARIWLLTAAVVGISALNVAMPAIALEPFLLVPMLMAAAFAGPAVTGTLAGLAMALAVASGLASGYEDETDFWLRLLVMTLVAVVTVELARRSAAAAESLTESEQRFRLLAENVSDVVMHTRGGVIVWASPSVTETFGGDPEDWVGRNLVEVVHPDDLTTFTAGSEAVDNGATATSRVRIRAVDGSYHWAEAHARIFRGADGRPDGHIASLRIVDDLVDVETELTRRAHYDGLTGLLNRSEFLRRLGGSTGSVVETGHSTAVLFCDIDGFKGINDTFGHTSGDMVLRSVAQRVQASIRDDDTAARMGGDEILVVLTGVRDIQDATSTAESIRGAVGQPIGLGRVQLTITISIGVTLATPGEPIDDLINRADRALYQAKRGGRDRVVSISAPPP